MASPERDASPVGGGESQSSASTTSDKKVNSPQDAIQGNDTTESSGREGIAPQSTSTRASPTKSYTIGYDDINTMATESLKAIRECGSKLSSPAKKRRPVSARSANGALRFHAVDHDSATRNISSSDSSETEDVPGLILNAGPSDTGVSKSARYHRTNIRRANDLGLNLDEPPVLRPTRDNLDSTSSYKHTSPRTRPVTRSHNSMGSQKAHFRREPHTPHVSSSFQAPRSHAYSRGATQSNTAASTESNVGSGVVLNRIESMIADSRASSTQPKPKATMYLPQENNNSIHDNASSLPEQIPPKLSEKPRLQSAPDISYKLREFKNYLNRSPNRPSSARTSPIHRVVSSEEPLPFNFNFRNQNEASENKTPNTDIAPSVAQLEQQQTSSTTQSYDFPQLSQPQGLAPSPVFPSEGVQDSASVASSGSVNSNFRIHSGLRRHGTPSLDQTHTSRQNETPSLASQSQSNPGSSNISPSEGPATAPASFSSGSMQSRDHDRRNIHARSSRTSQVSSVHSTNTSQASRHLEETAKESTEHGMSPISNKSTPTYTNTTPPVADDGNNNNVEGGYARNSHHYLPSWGGTRWKAFVKVVHESLTSSEVSGVDIDTFLGRVRDNLPEEMQGMTFVEFTHRFHTWQNIAERKGFL